MVARQEVSVGETCFYAPEPAQSHSSATSAAMSPGGVPKLAGQQHSALALPACLPKLVLRTDGCSSPKRSAPAAKEESPLLAVALEPRDDWASDLFPHGGGGAAAYFPLDNTLTERHLSSMLDFDLSPDEGLRHSGLDLASVCLGGLEGHSALTVSADRGVLGLPGSPSIADMINTDGGLWAAGGGPSSPADGGEASAGTGSDSSEAPQSPATSFGASGQGSQGGQDGAAAGMPLEDGVEATARDAKKRGGQADGAKGESISGADTAASAAVPVPVKRQRQQRPRISMPVDGFVWRKYGTKSLAETPNMRAYFWCVNKESGCLARKRVDHQQTLPFGSVSVNIMYDGEHNHPPPLLKQLDFASTFPTGLGGPLPPALANTSGPAIWNRWHLQAGSMEALCGGGSGKPAGSSHAAAEGPGQQQPRVDSMEDDVSRGLAALSKLLFAPLSAASPLAALDAIKHGGTMPQKTAGPTGPLVPPLPADSHAPALPHVSAYERATATAAAATAAAPPPGLSMPPTSPSLASAARAMATGNDVGTILGGAAQFLARPSNQQLSSSSRPPTVHAAASSSTSDFDASSAFYDRPQAPAPTFSGHLPSPKRPALGQPFSGVGRLFGSSPIPASSPQLGGPRHGAPAGPSQENIRSYWSPPLPPLAGGALGKKSCSADNLRHLSHAWPGGWEGGGLLEEVAALEGPGGGSSGSSGGGGDGGSGPPPFDISGSLLLFSPGSGGGKGGHGGSLRGVRRASSSSSPSAHRLMCTSCQCGGGTSEAGGGGDCNDNDAAQGMPRRFGLSRAHSHPGAAFRGVTPPELHRECASGAAGHQARLPPTSERLLRQLALPQRQQSVPLGAQQLPPHSPLPQRGMEASYLGYHGMGFPDGYGGLLGQVAPHSAPRGNPPHRAHFTVGEEEAAMDAAGMDLEMMQGRAQGACEMEAIDDLLWAFEEAPHCGCDSPPPQALLGPSHGPSAARHAAVQAPVHPPSPLVLPPLTTLKQQQQQQQQQQQLAELYGHGRPFEMPLASAGAPPDPFFHLGGSDAMSVEDFISPPAAGGCNAAASPADCLQPACQRHGGGRHLCIA